MFRKQTVFQASVILILATLVSRGMGFVREIVIAHSFGASSNYDVYLVAITFPVVICSLLVYAIPHVFIPIYLREKVTAGDESAWSFAWNFLNIFGVLFFFISLFLFILAPFIVKYYAPSFGTEQVAEAIALLRIACIIVFFGGIFVVLKSILNANKHFLLPAIAPLFLNVFVIASVLFLSSSLATRALAIGLLTGYFIQFLILLLVFFKNKGVPKLHFDFRDRLLKNVFGVLFLVIIIETIGQLNVVVDRSFASILPQGGISALNYAGTLYQIAIGAFGITVGTAIFPSMSEYVSSKDWESLIQLYSKGIRAVLVITIPIVCVCIVFSREIVALVYQRGAFDTQATLLTAGALKYLSIGLVAFVGYAILVKMYYAMHHELTLLISTASAFVLKILLSLLLVRRHFHQGLAVATSCAGIFNITILSICLRRNIGRIDGRRIATTFLKTSLISVLSVGICRWMMSVLGETALIFRLAILFMLGSGIFLGLAYLFRVEEVIRVFQKIRR
jgi:putative peptidoglycan lipid II flippase